MEVRLLRNGDGGNGFSLSRFGMRLSVSPSGAGVIQIQCEKRMPDSSDPYSRPSVMFSGIVEAMFGVFHDVEWRFLGNPIEAHQVAQHYLTEFLQMQSPLPLKER